MRYWGDSAGFWPVGPDRTAHACAGPLPARHRCYWCGERRRLLWIVRVRTGVRGATCHAQARCWDADACRARVAEADRLEREAYERRRPQLPNADARGCKWCGQPIALDRRRKGWKRRRGRNYHRGDEWERAGQPSDCLARALAWRNPTAAGLQPCLERQGGRCEECGYQLAQPRPDREGYYADVLGQAGRYWRVEAPPYSLEYPGRGFGLPRGFRARSVEIDHRVPIWDGGDNSLENLRALCARPCHAAKTAAEARERARRRREGRGQTALAVG